MSGQRTRCVAAVFGLVLAAAGLLGCSQPPAGDAVEWRFSYDEGGRLRERADPAGNVTRFRWETDDSGRVRRAVQRLPDATEVALTFDRFNRRITREDPTGTVRYRHDGFGQLVEAEFPHGRSLRRTWDTQGRPRTVDLGGGLEVAYTYDFLGRVERLATPAGDVVYDYQPGRGLAVRTLPNGVQTVWEYRPDGLLGSLSHALPDRRLLARWMYDYGPDGRLRGIEVWTPEGSRNTTYEYDGAGRLIRERDSLRGETRWRYDPYSNRLEQTAGPETVISTYDGAGRLLTHRGGEAVHDAAGNLLAWPGPGGGRATQREGEYDAAGRLRAAGRGSRRVRYLHDGDGNLVSRRAADGEIRFLPDPETEIWRPLLAVQEGGRRAMYVWEGGLPLARVSEDEVEFFLHDHLGSVRAITDGQGRLVERLDYDPFGVPLQEMEGDSLRPGFAGLFYDPQAALYLTRARAYDPELGRFLQRDPQLQTPLVSPAAVSSYAYADNDPVNRRDATGRQWMPPPYTYDPQAFNWMWQQPYIFQDPIFQSQQRGSHAWGRFLDTLSRWPNISWEEVGREAWQRGNEGEARFYFALDAIAYAVPHTPVVGSFAGHTTSLFFDPSASRGERLGAALGLGLDTFLLAGPSALQAAGKSYLAGAAAAPNSALYETFLRTGHTLDTLGFLTNAAGTLQTTAQTVGAVPKVVDAWRGIELEGDAGPLSPTEVGGVYLGGAGEALRDLGPLEGVAWDSESGRLVLLAAEGEKTGLPPLRLEDLVTVFRSVYEEGEAPFVSIDPDPRDPEGPRMLVRHGAATEGTYVGWVLFEADRVMKAYSLGYDNLSRQPVETWVEGYRGLLASASAGAAARGGPVWERFWIVPAAVERRQTGDSGLTLLDVPLRVETQRMVLSGGRLEPAPDAAPSPGAAAFARWFTERYDDISQEARSLPPGESGIAEPVAFYAELRRIASVAAAAEALRDQGVSMPGWMAQIEVPRIPVPPSTPAMVVEASESERRVLSGGAVRTLDRRQRLYGGVSLSPPDAAVHTVRAVPEAEVLARRLWPAVETRPLLEAVEIAAGGRRLRAVALPGAGARALGACRLEEIDLRVPVGRGAELRLERRFHSFFAPDGELGLGWTLDLPRLAAERRPLRRTADRATVEQVYRLTSPLQTVAVMLDERTTVPELGIETLAPSRRGEVLGLAAGDDGRIGTPTRVVIFRDGRRWHFTEEGDLAAREDGPFLEVFRRDGEGRPVRIEGWYGRSLRADLRLEYDAAGRLAGVRGSGGESTRYRYGSGGCLERVERPGETLEYTCAEGRVTAELRDGRPVRRFEYGPGGELLRQHDAEGRVMHFAHRLGPDGRVTATFASGESNAGGGGPRGEVLYDSALRLLGWRGPDGMRVEWRRDAEGVTATVISPEGDEHAWSRSADGRRLSWRRPEGGVLRAELDSAGRPVTVYRGEREALRQSWRSDGQPASVRGETFAVHPRYRVDGVLESLLLSPPEDGPVFRRWLEVEVDELGRPLRITSAAGERLELGYDENGRPAGLRSERGAVRVERDTAGRVTEVETSWGERQEIDYNAQGEAVRAEIERDGDRAAIELEEGRPVGFRGFGGTWTNISYIEEGPAAGRVQRIERPDQPPLTYEYSPEGRVEAVGCGDGCRVEYTYDAEGRLTGVTQRAVSPR